MAASIKPDNPGDGPMVTVQLFSVAGSLHGRTDDPPSACALIRPPGDGILPGSNGCLPEGVLSASVACQAPPCGASGTRREPGHGRVGCNPNDCGAGLDVNAGRATHGMASRGFWLGCRSRPAAQFSRRRAAEMCPGCCVGSGSAGHAGVSPASWRSRRLWAGSGLAALGREQAKADVRRG